MRKIALLIFLFGIGQSAFSQIGTISELVIQDNKRSKESFIKRLAKTKVGSQLDSTLIIADIIRLKRLPGIAHAYYQVHQKEDGSYKVVYGFEENFTLIPFTNVYTTINSEIAFLVGIQESNAFGQNIALGGYFQRDIFNSYGFNFRAPYMFTNKLGIAANFQDLTTREPVFLDSGTSQYKYNNTSYELQGLYEANFKNRYTLGLNFFTESYYYIEGALQDNVPQELSVDKFLYKGIHEYNSINIYYQYLSGIKNIFNAQYVTSTNKVLPEFLIFKNDFHFFKRIGDRGNWASRVTLGISSNSDSPFAPFSVDNNLNIRGVGNTIDRGTGSFVVNTEYRHTLFEKKWFVFQGNVFIDAGSWRNPDGTINDFVKVENIKFHPGLGVRFIHKFIYNTVFRIDYGVGISTVSSPRGFVIGIGQYF